MLHTALIIPDVCVMCARVYVHSSLGALGPSTVSDEYEKNPPPPPPPLGHSENTDFSPASVS